MLRLFQSRGEWLMWLRFSTKMVAEQNKNYFIRKWLFFARFIIITFNIQLAKNLDSSYYDYEEYCCYIMNLGPPFIIRVSVVGLLSLCSSNLITYRLALLIFTVLQIAIRRQVSSNLLPDWLSLTRSWRGGGGAHGPDLPRAVLDDPGHADAVLHPPLLRSGHVTSGHWSGLPESSRR